MEEEDVSEMVVSWVWKESDCALILTRVMLLYQLFGFGCATGYQRNNAKNGPPLYARIYIATPPTLRVLFHLMDRRHGPTGEDAAIRKRKSRNTFLPQKNICNCCNNKGGAE